MNTSNIAGFWRRIIALIYDSLIVIALILLGALISTFFIVAVWGKTAMESGISDGNWLFYLPSLSFWFGYYANSWIKSGQTLGMKPWDLYVVDQKGGNITLKQAACRFLGGFLGLGLLLIPVMPHKQALQDLISSTKTIVKKRK